MNPAFLSGERQVSFFDLPYAHATRVREYQAEEMPAEAGVPVPESYVAQTVLVTGA